MTVERTSWIRIWALFLVGVTAAFQVGKVPGELAAIAKELDLGLVAAGFVISIFSLIAAFGGIFLGSLAGRFGSLRLIFAGVVLGGTASLAGSFAETGSRLIDSRALEGLGFILTTTATPALILAEAKPGDRGKALGIWSMYMPAGMSAMMLIAGSLSTVLTWRGIWRLVALVNLAYGLIVLTVFGKRHAAPPAGSAARPELGPMIAAALRPSSLLLAFCFLTYAGNFLALAGFLPLMLASRSETAASAGLLTAIVVAVNMLGNAVSGFIARRSAARARLIAVVALIMGVAGAGVFLEGLPFTLRYTLALIFSAVGGIIPGTCFGLAESLAASRAEAGAMFGGLIQGAGIGQLVAPPLAAAIVEAVGGWHGDALFIGVGALLNAAAALGLARLVPKGK